MKISANINHPKPPIGFTSNQLYKVNLKELMPNGLYKEVSAHFSELTHDPEDVLAMKDIGEKWGEAADYIKGICVNFSMKLPDYKTYAVELEGEKPLAQRILSLSSIKEYSKDSMWGEFAQARPDLKAVDKDGVKLVNRIFKGVGELNVYGAIRRAKEAGFGHFDFESVNDDFYEAIKLFEVGLGCDIRLRCIYPRKMAEFMERVENKYKFG